MHKITFLLFGMLACTQIIEAKFICKGMVRLQQNIDDKPSKLVLNWVGDSYNFPIYVYMQNPKHHPLKPEAFIADGKWAMAGGNNEIYFRIPHHQLLRSKPLYIYFYMYAPDNAQPRGKLTLSKTSQPYFEFTAF